MSLTKTKTETKVIVIALEELIRKQEILKLKKFRGKINLDIDLNTLRGRKIDFS